MKKAGRDSRLACATTQSVSVNLGSHIENIEKARLYDAAATTPPRL
ncbi:unnamed protein product [Plutella xylostella]|uniref:(diamondback moth) hypothetical protein n=1 Tax=Plutella xylostella TaxID=51655 RepID=A0A8S4EWE0_PLUXY|nr:unnamed protein product [Plutella xylostella]